MKNKQKSNIIQVTNLTKKFKDFTAVDDISFNVKRGDIFACLGPNGAGKSTTIKILITLLKPQAEKLLLTDLMLFIKPADVSHIIGYVPQQISVDGTLTAYENLMLFARLYDIPADERKKRISEILQFLNLEEHANALVRTFSGGMIRKLEVGQAMFIVQKFYF